MSLTAISIGKLVSSVAVLGAAGFAGFNLMSTGCPLGTTCESDAAATTALVSNETAEATDSCCDLTTALVADKAEECSDAGSCCETKAECETKTDCGEGAAAQLVANTAEGACSEAKTECEGEAATAQLVANTTEGACSEAKTECADKAPCEGEAAAAQLVANPEACSDKKAEDCSEKSDCSEKTDAPAQQLVNNDKPSGNG